MYQALVCFFLQDKVGGGVETAVSIQFAVHYAVYSFVYDYLKSGKLRYFCFYFGVLYFFFGFDQLDMKQ